MEGDFNRQDGQNDKDVIISRLIENYGGNMHVASMSKELASWYNYKWGNFAYLFNDGVKHNEIKNEIYLRNINSFHRQVLHEHEMSNNDISLEYIEREITKQKHTIKEISDNTQNIDIVYKHEYERDERNEISDGNTKNHEVDIDKMKGVLLGKEEKEFNIVEQHKGMVKIFDECDNLINLINAYLNSDINSDRSMIVKGYETRNTDNEKSSLNFQKQQQQNNNDIDTIVQADGYDNSEMVECINNVNKLMMEISEMENHIYNSSVEYNIEEKEKEKAKEMEREFQAVVSKGIELCNVNLQKISKTAAKVNASNTKLDTTNVVAEKDSRHRTSDRIIILIRATNNVLNIKFNGNSNVLNMKLNTVSKVVANESRYNIPDRGKNKDVQGSRKTNGILNGVTINITNGSQYSMGEFGYVIIDDGG